MNDKQYDTLLGEIRNVQKRMDDIDISLEQDRQNLQDFNIRLKGVQDQVEELRKASNQNVQKIKNSVADVVEPVVGAAMELKDGLENKKKTLLLKEPRGNLLQRIFGR